MCSNLWEMPGVAVQKQPRWKKAESRKQKAEIPFRWMGVGLSALIRVIRGGKKQKAEMPIGWMGYGLSAVGVERCSRSSKLEHPTNRIPDLPHCRGIETTASIGQLVPFGGADTEDVGVGLQF